MSTPSANHRPFRYALKVAALSLLPVAAAPSLAETVAIPLGQQGKAWNVKAPRHGITKAQVESQFGTPAEKHGPVGEPPIYTWEYAQFSVYFEGDRVIHSVVKKQETAQR